LAKAAAAADDASRDLQARSRALTLLLLTLYQVPLPQLPPEQQRAVVLATSRATTDPTLTEALRGWSIAMTARLVGHAERLDWLLEGQVRVRSLLKDTPAAARPSPQLLGRILEYFAELGADGLPAADLCLELVASRVLPPDPHLSAVDRTCRIARHADEAFAERLFSTLAQQFAACEPKQEKRFAQAMKQVLDDHRQLLARPDAAAAFLVLFERLAQIPPNNRVLSPVEQAAVGMFTLGAAGLEQLPDAVRASALDRCAQVLTPLRDHANNMVRDTARRWLQGRAAR